MFPVRDNQVSRQIPTVTLALIGLNLIVYLWDRQLHLFGPSMTFADLGMRPIEVKQVLRQGGDLFPLVTVFTSMFLHGSFVHLLGNMLYLITFGPAVEWGLRAPRFALYYLIWGIAASAVHALIDPNAEVPLVGASGAIGGALGAYLILFPANKIEVIIPFVPTTLEVSAWVLLGLWFVYQVVFRVEGVANWAHVGGFLAGMATVLALGGRAKVLEGRDPDEEDYELI